MVGRSRYINSIHTSAAATAAAVQPSRKPRSTPLSESDHQNSPTARLPKVPKSNSGLKGLFGKLRKRLKQTKYAVNLMLTIGETRGWAIAEGPLVLVQCTRPMRYWHILAASMKLPRCNGIRQVSAHCSTYLLVFSQCRNNYIEQTQWRFSISIYLINPTKGPWVSDMSQCLLTLSDKT